MRTTSQAVAVALIVGLSGVAFAGGPVGGGLGFGHGKKSSGGSGMGGYKSGSIQPEAGGKLEGPRADPAGKGETGGKSDSAEIKRVEAPSGQPARGAGDVERLLGDLQALRERRVISEDEYQRYRRQVLDDFVHAPPGAAPR